MITMNEKPYTIHINNLNSLLKAIKGRPAIARIGVLGDSDARADGKSNAAIGAAHEYGSVERNLPMRSFLRQPLEDKLNSALKHNGAFNRERLADIVKTKSLVPWLQLVADTAYAIVMGAFASGGYGKWAPWKDPNYTNNSMQILVDLTHLRDSITTEVKGPSS